VGDEHGGEVCGRGGRAGAGGWERGGGEEGCEGGEGEGGGDEGGESSLCFFPIFPFLRDGRGGKWKGERKEEADGGFMGQVFRAIQAAYIRLLQNPFYDPDEHSPLAGHGGKKIESRRFAEEIRRIGEGCRAGSGVV